MAGISSVRLSPEVDELQMSLERSRSFDQVNLGLEKKKKIDEVQFKLEKQRRIDEVQLNLMKEKKIDEIRLNLEKSQSFDEVQLNLTNEEEENEEIRLTFLRALLVFINSLGTYLYRPLSEENKWSSVCTTWSYISLSWQQEREVDEEMKEILNAMKKSDTKFYQFFLEA